MKKWLGALIALSLAAGVVSAPAQVRVVKGTGQKSALNMHGFAAAGGGAATMFRRTLEADLIRSGWFALVNSGGEFSLLGEAADEGGSVSAKCQVFETASQRSLLNKRYSANAADARQLAHKAADEILYAITGRKSFFGAKLAVVGNQTKSKEVYICDSDGQGLVQLTRDNSISGSPKWSPDGGRIIYTSYLKRFPDLYIIDLASGARTRVASYPGLNTGGAFSPDGAYVAMILSKDGNPELYVKHLASGQLTRLTTTKGAGEASPSWSPDGNRIVYVSDQAGTPQLFMISRNGGNPARLTGRGSQNVAPDWGPGGLIAYASLVGGHFQVYVMDPDTRETKQITPGDADYEDPAWAPDGRHLACKRSVRYRSGIYLLDTMGDPPIALLEGSGDWSSPSWSPK